MECSDGAYQEYHDEVDFHTPGCLKAGGWYLDSYQNLDQMVAPDTG